MASLVELLADTLGGGDESKGSSSLFPEYDETNEFWARIYLAEPIEPKEWWNEKYKAEGVQIFPGTKENPCIFSGVLSPEFNDIHVLDLLLENARDVFRENNEKEKSLGEETDFQIIVSVAKNYIRRMFSEDYKDIAPEKITFISDTYVMLGKMLAYSRLSDDEALVLCKYFLSAIALGKIAQFIVGATQKKAVEGMFGSYRKEMNPHWYADWSKKEKVKGSSGFRVLLSGQDDAPEVEEYAAKFSYYKDLIPGYTTFISLLEAQEAMATIQRISSRKKFYELKKEMKEQAKKTVQEVGRKGGQQKNAIYQQQRDVAIKMYKEGNYKSKDAAAQEISGKVGLSFATVREHLKNITAPA